MCGVCGNMSNGRTRDVKDFAAHGYALGETAPFDMFPHTPHIECVARLDRVPAAPGAG